jgi:hypothetical protein
MATTVAYSLALLLSISFAFIPAKADMTPECLKILQTERIDPPCEDFLEKYRAQSKRCGETRFSEGRGVSRPYSEVLVHIARCFERAGKIEKARDLFEGAKDCRDMWFKTHHDGPFPCQSVVSWHLERLNYDEHKNCLSSLDYEQAMRVAIREGRLTPLDKFIRREFGVHIGPEKRWIGAIWGFASLTALRPEIEAWLKAGRGKFLAKGRNWEFHTGRDDRNCTYLAAINYTDTK